MSIIIYIKFVRDSGIMCSKRVLLQHYSTDRTGYQIEDEPPESRVEGGQVYLSRDPFYCCVSMGGELSSTCFFL